MRNFTNMKLGYVLLVSPNRPDIQARSLHSLVNTNVNNVEKITLEVVYKAPLNFYQDYISLLETKFNIRLLDDSEQQGTDFNSFAIFGASDLIKNTDVTHIGFLVDDFVYNPEWAQQLVKLISRHPDAKAWSVYRSAYTQHHNIIGGDGIDVLMTMHDCLGTMTREEWIEYGAGMKWVNFHCPPELGGGCTIDIHHAYARPGDRWATDKDYMNNIDMHNADDHAIDFVGE